MPNFNNKKVKASKKQFAGLLDYWLWGFLTEKAVKKTAIDFGFKIRNNEDFTKMFEELFVLDMWLIVYTCERIIFEDENKRNDVLDIFHHLEYGRYLGKEEESFSEWMMSITPRYAEYGKARETEHSSNPLWVVENVFNKRLFGETKEDLSFQTKVIIYMELFVKHLGEAILYHYEIN